MDERTGKINITSNTFSIHHFSATWLSKKDKIKRKIRMLVGVENWTKIKQIIKRK